MSQEFSKFRGASVVILKRQLFGVIRDSVGETKDSIEVVVKIINFLHKVTHFAMLGDGGGVAGIQLFALHRLKCFLASFATTSVELLVG